MNRRILCVASVAACLLLVGCSKIIESDRATVLRFSMTAIIGLLGAGIALFVGGVLLTIKRLPRRWREQQTKVNVCVVRRIGLSWPLKRKQESPFAPQECICRSPSKRGSGILLQPSRPVSPILRGSKPPRWHLRSLNSCVMYKQQGQTNRVDTMKLYGISNFRLIS